LAPKPHGYRINGFPREPDDFYPTPADITAALALGVRQLGIA
jgi:hypothetical protein